MCVYIYMGWLSDCNGGRHCSPAMAGAVLIYGYMTYEEAMDGDWPEGLRQLPLERAVMAWGGGMVISKAAGWNGLGLAALKCGLRSPTDPVRQFDVSTTNPRVNLLQSKKTHTTGHTNSVFQRSNPHMNQFSEVNPVLQCFQRSNFHINPHLWTGQFLYFSRTKPAVPLRRSPSAQRPCGGEGLRRDLLAFYVTWH